MLEHLVIAGLIYLFGVAIVLAIKPSFMFTEDGVWKEFGIGRNPASHTWMPFWLFAIFWAFTCYILVAILLSLRQQEPLEVANELPKFSKSTLQSNLKKMKATKAVELNEDGFDISEENFLPSFTNAKSKGRGRGNSFDLPKGYYILNAKATEEAGGIPKYVFLGKGLPEAD